MKAKIALAIIGLAQMILSVLSAIDGDFDESATALQTAVLFFIWSEVWT
jgi:Flp pilus assembly pilin Flp